MNNYFAKLGTKTDNAIFEETNRFEAPGYARCNNRFYRVVRITATGHPVLRFFGKVVKCKDTGRFEFQHAKMPKGRYPKDINANLTAKNYTPCRRGDWWQGAVTFK